jgi:hypothetical protein
MKLVRFATVILLVGVTVGACYNPSFVSGVTKCASDNSCPNNWICEANLCFDPALSCINGVSHPPSGTLITDFSDAVPDPNSAGDYRFGSQVGQMGGTVRYGSATHGTLTLSNGALTFSAALEAPSSTDMYPYSGFSAYMDGPACIDAIAYSGVSFTFSSTGTCQMVAAFNDSEHLRGADDPTRGVCTGSSTMCYPSQFPLSPTTTPTTTTVAFNATPTVPGMPTTTVDKTKLATVEWHFRNTSTTSGCSGSLTVDDVRFY